MKIKLICRWYDCYVGLYWDRWWRTLYIFPLPCLGIRVQFDVEPLTTYATTQPLPLTVEGLQELVDKFPKPVYGKSPIQRAAEQLTELDLKLINNYRPLAFEPLFDRRGPGPLLLKDFDKPPECKDDK